MSSLSQQLNVISSNNASLALDRKARSRLHSKSLIFDPKTASTQDYDYIYQISLEGLEELIELDSRFLRFKNSLFSETSISFDRNVQTKETLDQLHLNIEAFLNLVAPYYNLNLSLKAIEWLVRRFYINIHNSEYLLLTSLPFYQSQIFVKILNVIPKQSLPKIFGWISGYKDLLKPPPSSSILKSFHNDAEFYKLYSQFFCDQLSNKTTYNNQLVFFLSNTVQLLASQNKNLVHLHEFYLPTVLETIGKLLLPMNKVSKNSNIHDLKLTAYSIIAVLCSLIPLSSDLIESFTESILLDPVSLQSHTRKQTIIVLGQVWNFHGKDAESSPTSLNCFTKLTPSILVDDGKLLKELIGEGNKLNSFLAVYFLYWINKDPENPLVYELFNFINLDKDDSRFKLISLAMIQLVNSDSKNSDIIRSSSIGIFETLRKVNKALFMETLNSENKSLSDLEMVIMHTLNDGQDINDADIEYDDTDDVEDQEGDQEQEDFSSSPLKSFKTKTLTFIDSSSTSEFHKLSQVFMSNIRNDSSKSNIEKFRKAVFENDQVFVSFLIRIALSTIIPTSIRKFSLQIIKSKLANKADKRTKKFHFYLVTPILILGLYDDNKSIRALFSMILEQIYRNSKHDEELKPSNLYMEDQIYGSTPADNRSIIAPSDGTTMMELLFEENKSNVNDVVMDKSRITNFLFHSLFKASTKLKKFGQLLLKTFFLNQWALPFLSLEFKWRIWNIINIENNDLSNVSNKHGSDVRSFFIDSDVSIYFDNRDSFIDQAKILNLNFTQDVERPFLGLVGGKSFNEKKITKELDFIAKGLSLSDSPSFQVLCNERLIEIFKYIRNVDIKLKLCIELIDQLTNDNDSISIDPLETLQSFEIDHDTIVGLLSSVQILTLIPEQGVAKRRRRSSNSTKQNMARDDINNLASTHLRKLTIVLDVLEFNLRKRSNSGIWKPDLLQSLFKILTDLDYLGNDGNLPILYAQETLASCMLLGIIELKKNVISNNVKLDSNSVRADLIVNSIRLSNSPQVQNRLLLVIAELASLSPEIILHSVMPIFTFMGAHTIRQDDEFSSSALQQTIAKVIPALANNGSSSLSNEIEFLLTSFASAFQHIPSHRRVKLFVSLSKTLGHENSLYIILFAIGQQYANNISKGKIIESKALLEFSNSLLRNFNAHEILSSLTQFYELWNEIPIQELEKDSEIFKALSSRSIFGFSVVSKSTRELITFKTQLLKYVDELLENDSDYLQINTSLKLKVSLILMDEQVSTTQKSNILGGFRALSSLILSSLEYFTNLSNDELASNYNSIISELYDLLSSFLNLLPLNYFIESIIDSMVDLSSPLSIRIARNFAVLAGTKFENELNSNSIDEEIIETVIEKLLPVLVKGIESFDNTELVQSYLDTFSIIVDKFGVSSNVLNNSNNSKVLLESLKIIVSEKGLLNDQTEVIISSISAITSIINVLGVKTIGLFPKILPPALKIWEEVGKPDEDAEERTSDAPNLIQASVLALFACLVKKMPAFIINKLSEILLAVLNSEYIDTAVRSNILNLFVDHVDLTQLLKSILNLAVVNKFYYDCNATTLGLYINVLQSTIDAIDKKLASSQSTLFIKWLIKSLEFRDEERGLSFNNNTINRLESSIYTCGINYVLKLNDKNFRPLFATLVRWTIDGEGSTSNNSNKTSRYLAFFKFFNKLQENLRSIITSYYSYILEFTVRLLNEFSNDELKDVNLRRLIINSLTSSFKYDQEDYWSQQLRFELMLEPLVGQLSNIDETIGKYLVKSITSFVTNVSSDEYNERLINELIKYISNESEIENASNTKIWTIRVLKSIFQKIGEQWLSYLPTLIPYIAELLEDDDEKVEMEVRSGLVRVVENVLGEPLDRYLD